VTEGWPESPRWVGLLAWFWRTRQGRCALLVLLLAGSTALALLPAFVLDKEFEHLERAAIRRDARRVEDGIRSELDVLEAICRDWGIWDDIYTFAAGRNPAFAKINLRWEGLLANTKVHLVYVLDQDGRIVWGGFHPRDAEHSTPLLAFSQERIHDLPLLSGSREEPHTGLFMTPDGPLLLVSHPIKHSSNLGPAAGTLLMGRLLDHDRLENLSCLLAIPLEARDTLRKPLTPEEASLWARQGRAPLVRVRSRASLDILLALPDIYGKEGMILTLKWERSIHLQGLQAARFVFVSLFLASLTMAGVLLAAFFHHLRLVRGYNDSLEEAVSLRTSELQDAERRFRAFVDHTHDLMFWCRFDEAEGHFVLEGVNPATLRFIGRPLESVIGLRARDCLPAEIAESLERRVHACAEQGAPLVTENMVEIRGTRMVFQTALVPVPDKHGTIRLIAGSARDITVLREREEALLHAQKLESLGVLAGGIAHDFNNLLTAAQGNLDISALLLPPHAECLPYLEGVRSALAKAANLTRQMLAYSGRGRFLLQVHDLNTAVREMVALLEISIGKKATLVCDLAPRLPLLEADVAQLQQVIMNLVTNAADAIQDTRGTIRLRTWAETVDGEAIAKLTVQFMSPGPHVVLEVSDTGPGIAPEIQARIFEPFFSTKGPGRGLGLSAMLGILRSHQGGLVLESAPGAGTTFRLWFPASAQAQATPEPAEPVPEEIPEQTGMLLIVEDDSSIRSATSRLLREMDFPVVEAGDGLEGLERFREYQPDISLVLLDLTMPRMDGREFLAELRKLAPSLPVVITSGYSEQELPAGDPALSFLQKPYQSSELRLALLKALQHSPWIN